MIKNYIIGSGGFAKEVFLILKRNNLKCDGFVGLESGNISIENEKINIIKETEFLNCNLFANIYIGIGDPKKIAFIAQKYKNYNFPNLIDPNVSILGKLEMGCGNIFCCNSVFTTNIKIGSFNIFNLSCTIGHDVIIGSCNIFNPTCCISGNVEIKDQNLFGVNSTILENIKIESYNIIGACALVSKNIVDSGTYVGIPAKKRI